MPQKRKRLGQEFRRAAVEKDGRSITAGILNPF
jgi:hypothetical protein